MLAEGGRFFLRDVVDGRRGSGRGLGGFANCQKINAKWRSLVSRERIVYLLAEAKEDTELPSVKAKECALLCWLQYCS